MTDELIDRVLAESRALARMTSDRRIAPFLGLELTVQQLKIVLLVASGEATNGRLLAESLGVSAPAISSSVEKLVSAGYLTRAEDPNDRRITVLHPSASAVQLHEHVLGPRHASEEVLASLGRGDLEALLQGLAAWRSAAEQLR